MWAHALRKAASLRAIALMALFVLLACAICLPLWAASARALQVYFIDVEGGQSTLFVTPAGQSLLIDTGFPDHAGRDAGRIVAAAKLAGLKRIDSVLLTHYHMDHTGGVPQLVARIPVGTFYDHGPNSENDPATVAAYEAYQKVLATGKYKHVVPRPGDVLPIPGMKVTVVSSNGNLIDQPLPGGGEQNPYCKISGTRPVDHSENARSLGVLITFGKLKILDLGDLTGDKEIQLMCPVNRLGRVPILVVSHHGLFSSSTPALVWAIHPRVAVMNNGARKGGSTVVLDTVSKAPGLETLWELHFSEEGGAAHNTAAEYIANPQGTDGGYYFKLTAYPNGRFTIFNSRTGAAKNYAAR